jgi:hypothetical protein
MWLQHHEGTFTIPVISHPLYNAIAPSRFGRSARGDAMYLLRLFLMGWFSAGIVTVFFLYWLCSRTAAPLKEGKLSTFPDQRSGTDNQSHEVRAA